MSAQIRPIFEPVHLVIDQAIGRGVSRIGASYCNHRAEESATVPAFEVDATRWLRAVLRADTVPLETVIGRAKLEGVGLSVLWAVIRQSCIQQTGMSGARYLSWPRTQWRQVGAVPPPLSPDHDAAAVMRRLTDSSDDRIVCQACIYGSDAHCPGGHAIPDLIPNRCSFFKITNSESDDHEDL